MNEALHFLSLAGLGCIPGDNPQALRSLWSRLSNLAPKRCSADIPRSKGVQGPTTVSSIINDNVLKQIIILLIRNHPEASPSALLLCLEL